MTQEKRYYALDSLRGIACMQVVLGHCFNALPALSWMYTPDNAPVIHNNLFYLAYSPLHFFLAGPKAVKLFFILSGFVLSLPFYQKDINKAQYFNFFTKRILRLYLPCLAVILFSLLVKATYYNVNPTLQYGGFVKGMLSYDFFNITNIFHALILVNPVTNLNPVLWTLPPEIKLSLILPFFVYILRRVNFKWSIASIFLMVALNFAFKRVGFYTTLPDIATLYYMSFFLIGAVICKYKTEIQNWINSINNYFFYFLLISAIFLYTFNYSMWELPSKIMGNLSKVDDYVTAFPAALFLVFALSKRFEKILNKGFFKFLGKISFSLYLTHAIIIYSCVYLLGNYLNQYLVIGIGFIISIPISLLFYKVVEVNSLRFAKYFADKLSVLVSKVKPAR